MFEYKPIVESKNFIVLDKYEKYSLIREKLHLSNEKLLLKKSLFKI